ncbi:MAG: hypothetical protein M1816_003871 [Peltula sp. TS41687]|nr:MAG: hypothetical protein M1816_003871 [Peltula sp. TS41687]
MAARIFSLSLAALAFLLWPTWASPRNDYSQPGQQPGFAARNYDTIQKIYNLTLYPAQLPILTGGGKAVPPGLFDAGARGRISPVGNFTDFEDTIEYFWGLAPVPVPNNPQSIVFTRAELVAFQSDCPEVASSIAYLHTGYYKPNSTEPAEDISVLKQFAFWRFDEQGAVIYYDAYIPNLSSWTAIANGAQVNDAAYRATSIQQLCGLVENRCVGNNTQYRDFQDCVNVLSQKPFGEYSETWGDNFVCRSIHTILTQIRPEVHCKHVGPTGGGKCVDATYNDKFLDDEALFRSPRGTTFVCPQKANHAGY